MPNYHMREVIRIIFQNLFADFLLHRDISNLFRSVRLKDQHIVAASGIETVPVMFRTVQISPHKDWFHAMEYSDEEMSEYALNYVLEDGAFANSISPMRLYIMTP